LEQTGQSANSYIKALIKADLDNKGFVLPDGADTYAKDTDSIEDIDAYKIYVYLYFGRAVWLLLLRLLMLASALLSSMLPDTQQAAGDADQR